ncbi:MAG: class I SAM-dependent methyltransferase [bacterium]|nr:class I SAM-dependent methyltransferase [bacterium]
MQTTNVKVADLNYDYYSMNKYDCDIVNSIPFYKELHEKIISYVRKNYGNDKNYAILDLGVGTGITSKLIQTELPKAEFDLNDFSEKMLSGAKKKFGKTANYILGDYSKIKFNKKYDIIVSVIGIHHQNNKGKQLLFKKIYSLLRPDGIFIFGDLITYKDQKKAALNQALHFHHLVEKSTDRKTLEEWAHHHYVLNDLAPIEDQIEWLKKVGFKVKLEMLKINTALLICRK